MTNRQQILTALYVSLFGAVAVTSVVDAQSASKDWPVWRGPNRNAIADEKQDFVTEWDDTKNVIWKSKIPGRGHSSPIVVGDLIVLATAYDSEERQTVLGYDRKTGKQLWETQINEGEFPARIFLPNNTHASPTVSSDGKLFFAVFNNNDSAQLAALDAKGKIVWKKKAGVFVPKRYQFGYGASPLVHDGMVIVSSECERDGTMKAFETKTGKEIWSVKRDKATSYSSPIVAKFGDREMLLISGGNEVAAYNPKDGKQLWKTESRWQVSCGTLVWDEKNEIVFASGGFPQAQTLALSAKDGKVLWTKRVKCYEQSMLAFDGHVYAVDDNGIAYCWKSKDGTETWRKRLQRPVSSSPVLANGNIYIANERGVHYVFKANPAAFEMVAENQLGESHYATPAFCDNKIYVRVASGTRNNRQEMLYCLGKKTE